MRSKSLPGRSFRPSTGVSGYARLRFQLRRGRLRSLPMVENEAWWRRWESVLGERQPLMTGAAGRMVGGGVRSSAGSDETPRPKAASNPRGDSRSRNQKRESPPEGGEFVSFGGGGGNRTHVRGTSIAGFSVCSRLFYLAPWSVSWQPSARPARKISITAFGRDGNPAHLTTSIPDRRAEPREGRGYLSSQCVVIVGS